MAEGRRACREEEETHACAGAAFVVVLRRRGGRGRGGGLGRAHRGPVPGPRERRLQLRGGGHRAAHRLEVGKKSDQEGRRCCCRRRRPQEGCVHVACACWLVPRPRQGRRGKGGTPSVRLGPLCTPPSAARLGTHDTVAPRCPWTIPRPGWCDAVAGTGCALTARLAWGRHTRRHFPERRGHTAPGAHLWL